MTCEAWIDNSALGVFKTGARWKLHTVAGTVREPAANLARSSKSRILVRNGASACWIQRSQFFPCGTCKATCSVMRLAVTAICTDFGTPAQSPVLCDHALHLRHWQTAYITEQLNRHPMRPPPAGAWPLDDFPIACARGKGIHPRSLRPKDLSPRS